MRTSVKALCLSLVAMAAASAAQAANVITFSLDKTSGPPGTIPSLTWDTSPKAASCSASGGWSGAKANSGTETLAAVTASSTFTLACTWSAIDTAALTWIAPTKNADGTPLDQASLTGYRINYATSASSAPQKTINGGSTLAYTVTGLSPGVWSFQMQACTASVCSDNSTPPVTKTTSAAVTMSQSAGFTIVAPVRPMPPTGLTVQ